MALPSQALSVYPSADPANSSATFGHRPHSWPKRLGWVPNFSQWAPGDILLFDTLGDVPGKLIEKYQAAKANASSKQFAHLTHCAVYLGSGLIADARFRRVVGVRRLWPETLKRALCVLRFDGTRVAPDEVRDFIEEVYDLEDTPYGSAPAAIAAWLNGSFVKSAAPTGLVCSAMVEYAAAQAGISLAMARKVTGPMLPASFMDHPWLTPVQTEWQIAR